jgi:hypothetical protein
MVLAVYLLGAEQEVVEGQVEQGFDGRRGPDRRQRGGLPDDRFEHLCSFGGVGNGSGYQQILPGSLAGESAR